MKATPTALADVWLIESPVFGDDRGGFANIYLEDKFRGELGIDADFVQHSYSRSRTGTLRGMHFQQPHAQGKLVTVMRGAIWDVVLDIRRTSATFGQWVGVELTETSGTSLWIPPGHAHGFQVTSDDDAVVHYLLSDYWHKEAEGIVRWDDPAIGIDWPIAPPILSERDAAAPCLADVANLPDD